MVLFFAVVWVDFVEISFFMVIIFFGSGGSGDLGLMAVVFFAIVTSALSLKSSCFTHAIFSNESEKLWDGERGKW